MRGRKIGQAYAPVRESPRNADRFSSQALSPDGKALVDWGRVTGKPEVNFPIADYSDN
jgi:hypothetical protein